MNSYTLYLHEIGYFYKFKDMINNDEAKKMADVDKYVIEESYSFNNIEKTIQSNNVIPIWHAL